jgi:hypothetical protein
VRELLHGSGLGRAAFMAFWMMVFQAFDTLCHGAFGAL